MGISRILLLSAASVALQGVVAFDSPHPCVAYRTKVSDLRACATASAFCTSYLGGPGSFTKTSTATTTVYPGTVAELEVTTTTDSTQATTTTTLPISAVTPNPNVPRDELAAQASCGIRDTRSSAEISGACNCVLAARTTVTQTVTGSTFPTPSCNVFNLQSSGPAYEDSIAGVPPAQGDNVIFKGGYPTGYFSAEPNGHILCLNVSSTPLCIDDSGKAPYRKIEVGHPSYLNSHDEGQRFDFEPLRCDASGPSLACTFNNGTQGVFGIVPHANQLSYGRPVDIARPISLIVVPQCGGS